MYFLQFSFERFLANTRLHLLRVKGPSINYISPFVHCIVSLLCLTFELYSISWSSCFIHVHLCHCLFLSLHFVTPLSVWIFSLSHCILTFPVSWHSSNGKELQFVFLCFLCSPLPFDKGVHDSMTLWGLSPLLTVKCTNKSTDGLRAVCIANIVSVLSSVECNSLLW